jgi:hypothetical protein
LRTENCEEYMDVQEQGREAVGRIETNYWVRTFLIILFSNCYLDDGIKKYEMNRL